jgi:hypothetical protein
VEKEFIKELTGVSASPGQRLDDGGARLNDNQSGIRYASEEEFKKAQRKTTKLHAGLFRRLAK